MYSESSCKEDNVQALFLKIPHLYFKKAFQQLADTGVHPKQIPMIKLLGEEEGLSQREISQRLHIEPPTVTVSLKRLEHTGLIDRRLDEKDQRISHIYLTEKGEALNKKMMSLLRQHEDALFRGFTESEICLMKRFFKQIIKNLENITVEKKGKESC